LVLTLFGLWGILWREIGSDCSVIKEQVEVWIPAVQRVRVARIPSAQHW